MSDTIRRYHWLLVLTAKRIPHVVPARGRHDHLYVPPVAEAAALAEIRSFEGERRPSLPLPGPSLRANAGATLSLLLPIALWHGVRLGSFSLPAFLPQSPDAWMAGALDRSRVLAGEWLRCATALTMHADGAHLAGNLALGALFGIPLGRRLGAGLAFLLTILAGILGNALTVAARPVPGVSLGLSTAVFGTVGLLCSVSAAQAWERAKDGTSPPSSWLRSSAMQAVLPVGAALGILALLGGAEAPKVDYLAHVCGLACGLALGAGAAVLAPRLPVAGSALDRTFQAACALGSYTLLAAAWAVPK